MIKDCVVNRYRHIEVILREVTEIRDSLRRGKSVPLTPEFVTQVVDCLDELALIYKRP